MFSSIDEEIVGDFGGSDGLDGSFTKDFSSWLLISSI